jgi:hypothetical protein
LKQITNWRKATVFDLEADNLLDEATLIHVLCYQMQEGKAGEIKGEDKDRLIKFFNWHIESSIPVVAHNGVLYDVPLVEKLLKVDLSRLMVIDSLALSWYLNTERMQHGLASFLDDFGIEKPEIESWVDQSYEEYLHRCREDVKINVALWEDLKERLTEIYSKVKYCIDNKMVDGTRVSGDEVCHIDQYKGISKVDDYIDRILTFLMFKADCARLKEKTRFKVDTPELDSLIEDLSCRVEVARVELEGVMPSVPQYTKKNSPAKPFKKDGSRSASGISWDEEVAKIGFADVHGNHLVRQIDDKTLEVLKGYEPPNINGHQQIKDFLFSKGWKPRSFKFVKDEEAQQAWADSGFKKHLKPKPRAIPQVSVDGDDGKQLCESVLELAESVPEIMSYAKYTTIKHRLDMCKGFKRDLREGGYLCARVGGYTNTLREQHRELVNLPSAKKPLGREIRGLLIANDGCVLLGSDLSSLEDRVKMHFMIPHDPEYVATMSEKGFDPHLAIANMAGIMSNEQVAEYKHLKSLGDALTEDQKKVFEYLGKIRQTGKSGNYACQYGSGAETLARAAGISLDVAKKVVDGYGKLNWAIKAISGEQCVIKDSKGGMWLVNPINGFAYSLRGEKDKFSTLCQGTGSFFFDMWTDEILEKMQARWSKKTLTFTAHDENVFCIKELQEPINEVSGMIKDSIGIINNRYCLRRELGCDTQIGKRYGEIH